MSHSVYYRVCTMCGSGGCPIHDGKSAEIPGNILRAFEPNADDALLNELRQYRSGPGTEFDEAMQRLSRRINHLRQHRDSLAGVISSMEGRIRRAHDQAEEAASILCVALAEISKEPGGTIIDAANEVPPGSEKIR